MPEKASPDPPLDVPLVSGADKNYRNEKYLVVEYIMHVYALWTICSS